MEKYLVIIDESKHNNTDIYLYVTQAESKKQAEEDVRITFNYDFPNVYKDNITINSVELFENVSRPIFLKNIG